jgi:hypothetical protein
MNFVKGLISALWVTACFYGVYEIGVWQGKKKCKHIYHFKTVKAAFLEAK